MEWNSFFFFFFKVEGNKYLKRLKKKRAYIEVIFLIQFKFDKTNSS